MYLVHCAYRNPFFKFLYKTVNTNKWGIGIFFLHDTNGRALQANRAGPNWPNPSSPFLLMSTGNTKALPFLQCKKKMRMPHSNFNIQYDHCTIIAQLSTLQKTSFPKEDI